MPLKVSFLWGLPGTRINHLFFQNEISLVIDAGIIAISSEIPDSIQPECLKKEANTRVESFTGRLEQIIDDPIIVLESVAQSISDTLEKEGNRSCRII